jgi:phage terminase large subunit-like protein
MLAEWDRRRPAETVWRVGRRSGKTVMASILGTYNACVEDYSGFLRPGERRYVVCVATTLDQSRIALRTMRELITGSPMLRPLLVSDSSDELELTTGAVIRAIPCSARAGRGLPISCLILDELGHFVTTDEGNAAGARVLAAMAPSVAQFGTRGHIIALSTPYAKQGAFWDLWQRATSGEHADMWAVHAPTWEVNPTIPEAWFERQRAKDPDAFRIEFAAEWAEGIASYFAADAVRSCVARGVIERPPMDGARYIIALDPAFVGDRFAAVVASDQGERISVDAVRVWRGSRSQPVQLAAVMAEVESLARAFNRARVISDQYSAEPIRQAFHGLGVSVELVPWTNERKLDSFSALKQRINTGAISLPDHEGLIGELTALEIRQTGGGKPKIGAPSGRHDDISTALAACVYQLGGGGGSLPFQWITDNL